jgi:hypothetical protein
MQESKKLPKSLNVFFLVGFTLLLHGCFSVKSVNDLNTSLASFEGYYCVIFTNNSGMYLVDSLKVSDDLIFGKITTHIRHKNSRTIHLSLKRDSLLAVDSLNILRVPKDNVVLLKKTKFSFLKIAGLLGAAYLTLTLFISAIFIQSSG